MARRDQIDPETARLVEQRLQWLLTEHGPAGPPAPPAAPVEAPDQPGEPEPVIRPRRSRPEGLPPSPPPGAVLLPRLSWLPSFRRPHLVIVAAIVAVGIVLACWAALRARPVAVAVTPPPVVASQTTTAGPPAASPADPGSSPATEVVVHVLGAVRKPGLARLTAGSRVQDALEAAGGLTGKADPGQLNLAQPLADGQQIVVGTKSKPTGEVREGAAGPAPGAGGSAGSGTSGGAPSGSGQAVNLNTATQAELEELPGVGPVMAGKIIAWRTENGRFSRVEELQEIDGIGPKTYAKLAPLCRV